MTRNGAGIAELLDVTGFKTYSAFIENTTIYEKQLIAGAIRERNSQQQSALPEGLR